MRTQFEMKGLVRMVKMMPAAGLVSVQNTMTERTGASSPASRKGNILGGGYLSPDDLKQGTMRKFTPHICLSWAARPVGRSLPVVGPERCRILPIALDEAAAASTRPGRESSSHQPERLPGQAG